MHSLPALGDLYSSDSPYSSASLNKSDASSVWAGEVQIRKEQEKRKNDFLRHLESEEVESARKKQKPDNKQLILDDQDKDICEDGEDDIKGEKLSYEAYKKIYDLDNQVSMWSDYLSARFHPQTNVVVGDYLYGDMRTRPFDIFGLGYSHEHVLEEVEDRVRFFAEEADHLRGFHLLADANDAFGGVGSKVSELLADEYSSKVVTLIMLDRIYPWKQLN